MVIYNLMSAMMGIAVLIYVRYCVRHQGIHLDANTRNSGWKTKKESPFHYWFGTIILTILGLFMIVGPMVF